MSMRHILSYTATQEDHGLRLDVVCATQGLYSSRSAAARAIADGKIYVNGVEVTKRYSVSMGDTIVYIVEDEVVSAMPLGQSIALDIRYEGR